MHRKLPYPDLEEYPAMAVEYSTVEHRLSIKYQ